MSELILILIITYTILITINRLARYDKISKVFIYTFHIVWGLVLLITCFQPYDLYLPHSRTYIILAINLLSFTIGFNLICIRTQWYGFQSMRTEDILRLQSSIKAIVSNKFFLFYISVLIIYLINLLRTFFAKIAIYGNLGKLREDFFYDNFYGPFFNYIYLFLLVPTLNFVLGLTMSCTFCYRKLFPMILMYLYIIMYSIISGGRLEYIAIFIAFLFFFLSFQKMTKKRLFMFVIVLTSTIITFSYITNMRGAATGDTILETVQEGQDLALRHAVSYSCGSIIALDYAVNNNYMERIGGPKLGGLSTSSVIALVNMITKRFGLDIDEPISDLIYIKQKQYIPIGLEDKHNALYTSVLYPYLDFGIVGVLILPMFIGLFIRKSIASFYRSKGIYSIILLTCLYIQVVESIFDSFIINNPFIIMMLILLYLISNRLKTTNMMICKN